MDARFMGRRLLAVLLSLAAVPAVAQTSGKDFDAAAAEQARGYLEEGREAFRFDTFGSEDFWGGRLKLHAAIAGEELGGTGPGLSPQTALELGLKVDVNGFYHDGRFATLADVVEHYDRHLGIGLTDQERIDLIEYLKSI